MAVFAATVVAITILLGKAVTLAAAGAALPPRHRRSRANVPGPGPTGRPEVILQDAFTVEPWNLRETHLDLDLLAQTESVFALANGHVGWRGNLDEGEPHGLPGTYLNGVYESRPLPYAEQAYGLPESGQTIINVTNGKLIRLFVDDEPFDVRYGTLRSHERLLDFRAGMLTRRAEWVSPAGTAGPGFLDPAGVVHPAGDRGRSATRSSRSTAGRGSRCSPSCSRTSSCPRPTPIPGWPRRCRIRCAASTTTPRERAVVAGAQDQAQRAAGRGGDGSPDRRPGPGAVESRVFEDGGLVTATTVLQPGQRLRVIKFVAYGWSGERSLPAVRDQVWAALSAARQTGWDGLLAEQRAYLDDFWDRADVEVDGDPEIQQAVRFGLFHVLQAGARAEDRPIPAKGLTGPGYDGHAFWDTETFVLPVLTLTTPDAAASALRWRHSTLPLAIDRAAQLGLRGRGLPVADDRRPGMLGLLARGHRRLPRQRRHRRRRHPLRRRHRRRGVRPGAGDGPAGPHRAAVALARPLRRRGPVPHRRGHRTGRVQRHRRRQRLHEPDGAAEPAGRRRRGQAVPRARPRARRQRRGVRWLARRGARPCPSPTTRRSACTPRRRGSPGTRSGTSPAPRPTSTRCMLHFPYFDLYRKQVVKQADLVLAMHLCGDAFTAEQKARNFDYYERLTVRDSSLSACTQAVIAAEVGHLDLAYDYLGEAALMDLHDLEHNTRDGVHIASLAGTWIALVGGFGGLRRRGRHLQLRAAAPRRPHQARVQPPHPRPAPAGRDHPCRGHGTPWPTATRSRSRTTASR